MMTFSPTRSDSTVGKGSVRTSAIGSMWSATTPHDEPRCSHRARPDRAGGSSPGATPADCRALRCAARIAFGVRPEPGRSVMGTACLLDVHRGIETRPVFYPMHQLPPYREPGGAYPNADYCASRGICLPTHGRLTDADIER